MTFPNLYSRDRKLLLANNFLFTPFVMTVSVSQKKNVYLQVMKEKEAEDQINTQLRKTLEIYHAVVTAAVPNKRLPSIDSLCKPPPSKISESRGKFSSQIRFYGLLRHLLTGAKRNAFLRHLRQLGQTAV